MLLAEESPTLAENRPRKLLLLDGVRVDIVGVSSLLHEPYEELHDEIDRPSRPQTTTLAFDLSNCIFLRNTHLPRMRGRGLQGVYAY